MTRALYVVAFALFEAAAASGPRRSEIPEAELLAGNALPFEQLAAPPQISIEQAFALDAEMRAFAEPINELRDPSVKLTRLLEAMRDRGLFEMTYTDSSTRSVSRTFHDRQGNCLSFTMLFVTLARAAGLEVHYQVVDVPPTWTNELGLVVIGAHVNASVNQRYARSARTRHSDGRFADKVVIDFNAANFRGNYRTRIVNDRYIGALFYNNLAAEALLRQQYDASLVYLREAIQLDDDVPAPWVNLGVLYSRHRLFEHAESAYLRALDASSREPSALANLASVYAALGEEELAAEYRRRVRRYLEVNPYYHYSLAQAAFEEQRFEDALAAVRSAIRLKRDEEDFYRLRGRTLVALGRSERPPARFSRAEDETAHTR